MKVNVINPTDSDISVVVNGHSYTVEAKGTVAVEEVDAAYWKEKLHNFLLIDEIKAEKAEKEEKVEVKEEKEETKKEAKTK